MMSQLKTACSLNAIRLFLVICFLALVQFEFGCSPSLAQERTGLDDEQILPDFSNVRGLNYIASYAASDVAMWRNYDHDQIDRELSYIAGIGVNSIRVWLAWD